MNHYPWRYLEDVELWHLGTWISGALGSAGFMVGLKGFRGRFQHEWLYDFMGP